MLTGVWDGKLVCVEPQGGRQVALQDGVAHPKFTSSIGIASSDMIARLGAAARRCVVEWLCYANLVLQVPRNPPPLRQRISIRLTDENLQTVQSIGN